MISRVITGGQSGADLSGWVAAKRFGIPTGGYLPRGFLTEDGPRPEYARLYGAIALSTTSYPVRTRANVSEANALIWFGNPESPGGKLTTRLVREHGIYPSMLILGPFLPGFSDGVQVGWISRDLSRMNGVVLLVAGNRESSNPGIGAWVEAFLCDVFRAMGYEETEV